MFPKLALLMFSGKEVPNLMDPLDWDIHNQRAPHVKICTWEQI